MLKKKERYTVAVIGATGAVGLETLGALAERKFPVGEIRLYASARSAGERLAFRDEEPIVRDLAGANLGGVDLAFISATEEISREWAPKVVEAGGVAIDDSSVFRMDPQVPLVVPEVNEAALNDHRGIVAIPNCTTTPLVMVLKPLSDAAGIRRVVVTTFQSVSGTGKQAMDELLEQTRAILSFREVKTEVYPYQIAFNCLPHIGSFGPEGDCSEETKIVRETRKILGLPELRVTATTVRVPVFRCHSESVNIEMERRLPSNEVRAVLSGFPGLTVYDDPGRKLYPLPIDVAGQDAVFVGRIREDASVSAGVSLWIVSDNLRKGAALNAVQIAEALLRMTE
jgi:aspartate-semialdehyde dehydrogenase